MSLRSASGSLDHDENEEPWFTVYGTSPRQLEVQRTKQNADMWALYVALDKLKAQAKIYMDNFGCVSSFQKRKDCVRQSQAREDAGSSVS